MYLLITIQNQQILSLRGAFFSDEAIRCSHSNNCL